MPDSAAFATHRPEFAEPLWRGDARVIELMRTEGELKTFAAGETIVEGGGPHDLVYRLRKGWVCRVRLLEDGRTPAIAIFLPGDLFAVKSMYLAMHPDTIQASSVVEAEAIDRRRLHAAASNDPDVMVRLLQQLMEDERRLHNHVIMLGAGTARERLASLLVDLRGRLVLCGAISPSALSYSMPFTQEDLGDKIGLSTIHVNRVLKELREAGLVTVKRGQVRISHLARLRSLAYPLLDAFQRAEPAFGAPSAAAA